MIKKIFLLLISILFLYFAVSNKNGIHISSIELLDTGNNSSVGNMGVSNFLLNTAANTIYTIVILRDISLIFRLQNYISTRGGCNELIRCLIKSSLKNILIILLIKQMIYIIFYSITPIFSHFYVFNMVSMFLTLSIFALILIITKILGINENLSLFSIVSITAIAQFMSYKNSIFAYLVVASTNWNENIFKVTAFKLIAFLVFIYIVFNLKNLKNN